VTDLGGDHERDGRTNVRRLQPLRILLAGRDRRFLRVTSFLLSRRGYEVSQASIGIILEAVERKRADVVLLEPGESKAAAARTITALQLTTASPALLLITDGDDGRARWNGLAAVDKWTPIEDLVKAIETAAFNRIPPTVTALAAEPERGNLH
jgi:CheY-like chemotaxis protein